MSKDYFEDPTISLKISLRGTKNSTNYKVCWEARDEYYDCIEKQINKNGLDGINKKF